MGSLDRIPVSCTPCDDFENERYDDMWNLIKPEPRVDAFNGLLNSGQELKESVLKTSWDLAPSKAYVPVARSRSSLSSDSLQLCTEGLGCESCDCMMDSASSESSFGNRDDSSSEEEDEDMECEVMEENMEKDEKISPPVLQPRSFPPPLPSLCASSASYMRSFKKDGRFLLQSVKMPTQNFLHSFREGGRLKMQLVTFAEDDSVLPQASSTLIKPENEILSEEVDAGGGGSDSEETKACSSDEIPVLEKCSDIPEVQELEDFSEISETVSNPGDICNGCEIQKRNAIAEFKVLVQPQERKFKSNNKSSAPAKSVENHEIFDINPSKTSFFTDRACFNVYSGWRTELADQNSSNLCHNWQNVQTLPNYHLNKFKFAEADIVNLNVNVNESCLHYSVPKFRVNDLGLGRCHSLKSLSAWGKSQCIATNS